MNTRPLCLLVIDDEPVIGRTVDKLLLQRIGWMVQTATDPNEGVALARRLNPDVILCDAQMPRLSGMQVIAKLKADPEMAHIPIVLTSGCGEADDYASVPFTGFLPKPFGWDELRAAIESAMESVHQKQE